MIDERNQHATTSTAIKKRGRCLGGSRYGLQTLLSLFIYPIENLAFKITAVPGLSKLLQEFFSGVIRCRNSPHIIEYVLKFILTLFAGIYLTGTPYSLLVSKYCHSYYDWLSSEITKGFANGTDSGLWIGPWTSW